MSNQETTKQASTLSLLRALQPHRRLTGTEIAQITERQAARLRTSLGIREAQFPVEAITELPRITVRFDPELPSSGMTFWNGHEWVILLDSTESRTRQRFSLVHEYKHIIDHGVAEQVYGTKLGERSAEAERAADYFAACVLMPKMLVKRHFGQGPRTVTELAHLFDVSPAAMKYRLDHLGLIEKTRRCQPQRSIYHRTRPRVLEIAA
ncbi:MAG: ImmA/IrrE family metallo-endopeptidase [Acidimicrobiales bacterium]